MRYLLKATTDVNFAEGERSFDNKAGDTLEVSGAWYERIVARGRREPAIEGAYEIVKEIPESDVERKRVAAKEEKAKLMKEPKETLVKKAEKLGVDASLNKEPLAEAIAEAKTENSTEGDKN